MKRICVIVLMAALLLRCATAEDAHLKEMFHALRTLGIEIPDRAMTDIEESIADIYSYMPGDLENDTYWYDYQYILGYVGMGEYNEETFEYTPYTDDLYAFDTEAYDIQFAYEDLLQAIARMSDGEISITNYSAELSEELFQSGYGKMPISFSMNGQNYRYNADFETDWIDCGIIDCVNDILKETGNKNKIWNMFDGGQGLVLFYGDADWAGEFYRVTGYELEVSTGATLGITNIIDLLMEGLGYF